jgi:hypothetical protein
MAAMEEARRVAGARAQALMAGMTSAFAAGQVAGPVAASTLVRGAGDLDTAMLAACATLVLGAGVLRIDPKGGRS